MTHSNLCDPLSQIQSISETFTFSPIKRCEADIKLVPARLAIEWNLSSSAQPFQLCGSAIGSTRTLWVNNATVELTDLQERV